MNLLKVQDDLRTLPNTPQVKQLLLSYANGMSVEVPPYLALIELERRNKYAKAAQAGQPPQGTVKDKVEQEAETGGLAGLLQQMPQQMPQPPQQMQQPQQPQPQQQMSGVASAPVPQQMFSAGGGIVAFAGAGDVQADDGEDEDEFDTTEELKNLLRMGRTRMEATPPAGTSPIAQREALIKQYPHLAVLDEAPGRQAMAGLQALQAKQAEEDAKQREELQGRRKMELYKSLIAAGEATRGQKGIGGLFGGFGKSMIPAEAALGEEERAIRGRSIQREAEMNKLQNDIVNLQRARAEGDIAAEQKYAQQAADRANKLGISQNNLLRGMLQGVAGLAGRQAAAEASVEGARMRANRPAGSRDTAQDRQIADLAKGIRVENPGMSEDEVRARAVREFRQRPTATVEAANIRATTEDLKEASKAARRLAIPFLGKPEYEAKVKEFEDAALANILARRRAAAAQPAAPAAPGAQLTPQPAPAAQAAPAARPAAPQAAPAAPSATPPANILKRGMITSFANGQSWTLDDNGQPKRVK